VAEKTNAALNKLTKNELAKLEKQTVANGIKKVGKAGEKSLFKAGVKGLTKILPKFLSKMYEPKPWNTSDTDAAANASSLDAEAKKEMIESLARQETEASMRWNEGREQEDQRKNRVKKDMLKIGIKVMGGLVFMTALGLITWCCGKCSRANNKLETQLITSPFAQPQTPSCSPTPLYSPVDQPPNGNWLLGAR